MTFGGPAVLCTTGFWILMDLMWNGPGNQGYMMKRMPTLLFYICSLLLMTLGITMYGYDTLAPAHTIDVPGPTEGETVCHVKHLQMNYFRKKNS
jgi:hypothetical protein